MDTLTTGSPSKVIVKFALPIFIGNILQQLYQLVDNIIVGQCISANAFAAVGATYGMFFLISGFIWGITTGFTVLTAQKYGEGNLEDTRKSIGTAITLSGVLTLLMTMVLVSGMPLLFRITNIPDDIYKDAYDYIIVICAGLMLQVAYNLFAGVLRAVGNSKIPLYFLIFTSVLNIVLDLLFIVPLNMGVRGAALATVISQGVSAVLCFVYIQKHYPYLALKKKDFRLSWEYVWKELSVGVPMALQYAITSIGMLMIQTSVNLLGTSAVAAYSVGNKIEVVLEQGPIAIGSAMASYSAQNYGAGKIHRIRQGTKVSLVLMLVYFGVLGIATAFFGKYLTYLFISENVCGIIGNVDVFLKIISATGILLGVLCIYRNCVQGMGYGIISLAGGILELIARTFVAFITMRFEAFWIVCTGYPAAWVFAAVFFIVVYLVVMRKHRKCLSDVNDT